MANKRSFLPLFLFFLILSFIVLFLSSRHILFGENLVTNIFFQAESGFLHVVQFPGKLFQHDDLAKLKEENSMLRGQLVHMKQVEEDNVALRYQFETTQIPSIHLLPAQVIGKPQFIPGVSFPENLVIAKGKADGVVIGDTVVEKTDVVGQIFQVADHAALVHVVSNKASSFTAKTSQTNAQGVLIGAGGGEMVLENVVLSDTLRVGDIVVTAGSQDIAKNGFAPGLIVGKIISVHKNPSSLYQSASIESVLNIRALTTVFIVKE